MQDDLVYHTNRHPPHMGVHYLIPTNGGQGIDTHNGNDPLAQHDVSDLMFVYNIYRYHLSPLLHPIQHTVSETYEFDQIQCS